MNAANDRHEAATGKPAVRWLCLLLLAGMTLAGAAWLAFLCDDAFITFRYVANAHDGHGLVWNREPFRPVEGYTSFSWAMLLWAAWSWFSVAPPDSANVLSIAFGLGEFAIVAWAALQIRNRSDRRVADVVALVALLAIASNRTFLQWMTSGLETAMFNFAFVGWVLWAFRRQTASTTWLLVWSLLATLSALTRPDGLLLVAATAAIGGLLLLRRQRTTRSCVVGLLPLLPVAAHVLWRRSFYGEWLPNTYYAKVVDAWPEAGMRYLACFVVEHGMWLLPLLLVAWLLFELYDPRELVRAAIERPSTLAAIGAVVFHAAYYTFKIGGDHFEYRVFSHLVPLAVLAVAVMAARMTKGWRWPVIATALFACASSVGWLHFWLTRDLPPHGFQPLVGRLPTAVAPLARFYDRQQAWLLFHNIGLRCQQHAAILERFRAPFPGRLMVERPQDPNPVFAIGAVGIVGWCLPDCAILDHHGLNDWVIARTEIRGAGPPLNRDTLRPVLAAANANHDEWLDRGEMRQALALLSGGKSGPDGEIGADFLVGVMLAIHARQRVDAMTMQEADGIGDMLSRARSMAHERHPPTGYVEDFEPNVVIENGTAIAKPRAVALTDERVRELESKWHRWVLEQKH